MAVALYHVEGTTDPGGGSIEVPQSGLKAAVDATDGVQIQLNGHFWSFRHTGKDAAGAASTADVFYRAGTAIPVATYAVSNAAERASIPIVSGEDEIVQVKQSVTNTIRILAAVGSIVVLCRENEPTNRK